MTTLFRVLLVLILVYTLYTKVKESKSSQTSHNSSNDTNATSITLPTPPPIPLNFCGSDCPKYENCNFYQVTNNLTNYGCSLCKPDYSLTADWSGSGQCNTKSKIPHCVASQTFPSFRNNSLHCWACEKNYVLSYDLTNCDNPVQVRDRVSNCNNYYQNETKVLCNACDPGYTLSMDMKKCTKGCDIQNCDMCNIMYNVTFCFMCKPNTIGVLNPRLYMYSECLTCDELKNAACP